VTEGAIYTVWVVSLAIAVVVLVVVWALLRSIAGLAARVEQGVSTIWAVGQRVANNTVQLGALEYTNSLAADIRREFLGLVAALDAGAATPGPDGGRAGG
jgi:hypothetical protein